MPFVHRFTVPFADTDLAGIVHFANYFRYMENAEHAFVRSLGYSIHQEHDGLWIGWPRVAAECRFEAPLRFEDEVEVEVTARAPRRKSVTYEFRIRRVSPGPEVVAATGTMTAVCVALERENGAMRAVPIPADFLARLAERVNSTGG